MLYIPSVLYITQWYAFLLHFLCGTNSSAVKIFLKGISCAGNSSKQEVLLALEDFYLRWLVYDVHFSQCFECKQSRHETEPIIVFQCYQSLVLHINNKDSRLPGIIKVQTGSNMISWTNHITQHAALSADSFHTWCDCFRALSPEKNVRIKCYYQWHKTAGEKRPSGSFRKLHLLRTGQKLFFWLIKF